MKRSSAKAWIAGAVALLALAVAGNGVWLALKETRLAEAEALAASSAPAYPLEINYQGPARHVIVLSLDTTRADHFGFMGNPWIRTPNMDALAAESVVFDDCLTAIPSTLASHMTLFTGNYPQHHGVPRNGFSAADSNLMLPEMLAAAGFDTAGFISAVVLARTFNFPQGFAHWDETFDAAKSPKDGLTVRLAGKTTDAVLGWLDSRPTPEHLFLFVHYFDAHSVYDPPPPYDAAYADPATRSAGPEGPVCALEELHPLASGMAGHYAGEITYLDEQVGRLLAGLREKGLMNDSLLLVVSDHGETFGNEYFSHGKSTSRQESRMLALVRLPGAAGAGTRVSELIGNIDLLPAMARYLRLPEPPEIDGVVFDLLQPSETIRERERYCQASVPSDVEVQGEWPNAKKEQRIRSGRWAFVQAPYEGREALYDLVADPCEQVNRIADPELAETASELREKLETSMMAAGTQAVVSSEDLSRETLEQLESLGYVGK